MKRTAAAFLLAFLLLAPALAQETIHPDLAGDALLGALDADYSPATWYGYDRARDTLFRRIDGADGVLTGVYTGFTITLDPDADPTFDAFRKGVNTEHTYPRSMGANEDPAKSDMHHLFPVKSNVNSSRGNHPFDEIPDAETDAWYHLDQSRSTPPPSGIDGWAEKDNDHPDVHFEGRFEPRERHKGDAARAVFYFAAVYPERADRPFFEIQKGVLLAWHRQDPPDSAEVARTRLIAAHQGTPNPFVLDSSLVRRAYFEGGGMPVFYTVRYRFDGHDAGPTVDDGSADEPPVAFSDFRREGVEPVLTQGAFNSSGWPSDDAPDAELYVGFSAAPEPGAVVDLGGRRLSFFLRRSPTGPRRVALRYRTADEEAFTELETIELTDAHEHAFDVALPDVETSGRIDVRWHAWEASSSRGTLRIDDVALEFSTDSTGVDTGATRPRDLRPLRPAARSPFEVSGRARGSVEASEARPTPAR